MFVTFVTFLFVVRAPPLEAATLEATEAAVLATSRPLSNMNYKNQLTFTEIHRPKRVKEFFQCLLLL